MKQVISTGLTIGKKLFLYSTGILILIVILQASIQSSKEKSIRPLIQGIGSRTLATDQYIYTQLRELEMNPDKIYYDVKYVKAQKDFGSDKTRLQLEYQKLNSRYEKFKFYLSKTWTYIDLILSMWFLFTIFYAFYWIGGRFIIGHADNVFGAVMFALIVFILINSLFTFMLYNPRDYNNKNYADLDWKIQGKLINPFKGITELIMKFPFIIGYAYDNVVVPVEFEKKQPGVEGVIAKVLG